MYSMRKDAKKAAEPNSSVLTAGLMFVKLPNNERGRALKAWNKKWIEIKRQSSCQSSTGKSDCIGGVWLSIHQSRKSAKTQPSESYRRWINAKNAIIFRCSSRSQKHAFTICISSRPVIHLAGISETETQEWIAKLRNFLWTPNPIVNLEKSFGGHFDVSIIDNEYSYSAGLLGTYGYLKVSDEEVIFTHVHSGNVIQEWNLNKVSFKIMQQRHKDDENCVIEMIDNSVVGGSVIFYCKEAVHLIGKISEVAERMKESKRKIEENSDKVNLNSFNLLFTSECRLKTEKEDNKMKENENKAEEFKNQNFKNIPVAFLNCSISSNTLNFMDKEVDEEDIYSEIEEIEEIYEEIFEKITDEDCQIKLTPPPLPQGRRRNGSVGEEKEYNNNIDKISAILNNADLNNELPNYLESLMLVKYSSDGVLPEENAYCEMRPIETGPRSAIDTSEYVEMQSVVPVDC